MHRISILSIHKIATPNPTVAPSPVWDIPLDIFTSVCTDATHSAADKHKIDIPEKRNCGNSPPKLSQHTPPYHGLDLEGWGGGGGGVFLGTDMPNQH